MYETDALHKRGRALEDEFFHRVDMRLKEELRESMEREETRKLLADATGISDQALLDHLVESGFKPATMAALTLVPLIVVAWADGRVTAEERQTVMGEVVRQQLANNRTALQLVHGWLETRPPQSLWNVWKEYAETLYASMTPASASELAKEIRQQATEVAKASRGADARIISKSEQAVLDEIDGVSKRALRW